MITHSIETKHNLIIKNIKSDNSGEYCVKSGNFSRTIQLIIKDCFLEDPSNVEYIEGEDAILTCKVSHTSLPVEWFKDGSGVELDDNCKQSNEGTTHILSIKHAKSDDSGGYCVKVGNFSRKLQLKIEDCFLEDPSNVEYIEGADVILTCKVSPTSLPVKWSKDGNAVELDDNCEQSNEGTKQILSIKHAKSDDSGEYCVKVGNFSRKLQLKIKDCFLEDPSNVEYIEGADVILTCKVSPTSLPVEWLKDGSAVELNDNCEQSNKGTKHILSIKHAKSDDSGEYCVKVGNFSRKLQLKIKDCFLEDPSNVEYIEGADVILTCKVSPTSLPVKWLKDGSAVELDENCEQSNEGTKHILSIKHAESDDSGEYRVKVGNFSRKLQLKIQDCFLEDPSNVEYIEGADVILTCKVSPTSLPVKWFKDGNAVELGNKCEQSNEGTKHILCIKHFKSDDSGEYCVKVGNFSRKIQLKIKDCFLEDPSNVEYIEGADVILTCKVSPTNLPVKWLKDGSAVELDDNCEQSNEGTKHILSIKHAKSDDSGEYCVKIGNFSRKLQLKIEGNLGY
ncbi:obscurin-like protein 1 [Mytilus edulis]|uniref:obscurin-like protein 1 n=1 Tax=Mytilus edulis TaxID=6550 RepID=UPI0039F05D7E